MNSQAWEEMPYSVPFANAVTQAVIEADTGGGFTDMPPVGPSDGDTLLLEISTRQTPIAGRPTLMRAQIENYVVTEPAKMTLAFKAEYPETARRQGVESEGMATFVVGSNDRAVAETLQVWRTNCTDFSEPIREQVARSEYRSARSGGCRVPIAVRQLFGFALRRH